jgi:aminoglycoside phosphotransferase (APT) family kinase protein
MVPGVPQQARWLRAAPRREWPRQTLERMIGSALAARVGSVEPLTGGLRNANFKIHVEGLAAPVVLRIYEHDGSLCQKEVDLQRLVRHSVPVPEVLHAEPHGLDELPPYAVLSFVEGMSFRALLGTGDAQAIAEAAFSAGEVLAAIGRHTFSRPGWITSGPAIGPPLLDGADPMPRFVDQCLASENLRRRVTPDLCERVSVLMWKFARLLAAAGEETHLLHGDYSTRNLLVQSSGGRRNVAAVLDWEFAVAGCPLADIANLLRYETDAHPRLEPHFTNGFTGGGGKLPSDWRRLSKVIDLVALCEILTRPQLPEDVLVEVAGMVRETVA